MPPAIESRRERILQNLVTTLQGIVEGDDYWNTVVTVTRTENDIHPEENVDNWPLILVSANELQGEVVEHTNREVEESLQCQVYGFIKAEVDDNLAQNTERMIADIVKALETDPRRGGLADATDITGVVSTYDHETLILEAGVLARITFVRNRAEP
ncbi:hypothetical protein [Nitrospira sp. Nam74]